jgi:hypothetical protein
MRPWLLTLALAGAGCGSAEQRSPMDGHWRSGDPQTKSCAQTWSFDGDAFDLSVYCTLVSGEVGLEITRGSFIVAGDTITLNKARSTCANAGREPVVLSYVVGRNTLTLVSPTAVFTLARGALTLQPGSVARLGCFVEEGKFEPGMLIDL